MALLAPVARIARARKGWLLLSFAVAALLILAYVPAASGIAVVPPEGAIIDAAQQNPGESFGFSPLTPINDWIASILREVCNALLYFEATVLSNIATGTDLSKPFTDLIPSAMPIIEAVHWRVSVPLANLVLAIFLVAGLVKVVSHLSASESGVDLWKIMVVFIAYAFMKSAIDSSWYLMGLVYETVMSFLPVISSTSLPAASFTPLPDTVTDISALMLTLVVAILSLVIVGVCDIVCVTTVVVRSIQIYILTAFGAIPLAFAVSEGGRHMTANFIKKYVALVFSGLILALLFAMMASTVNFVGAVSTPPASGDLVAIAAYSMEIMTMPSLLIAYAFCFLRSGEWARDVMGL
uniref:Conjugal transfer protein TrbL n=1 Tax=Muribaculaceae bacterium Z82 TaxID=2304548 RepID=A0A7C9N9X1_9BACT